MIYDETVVLQYRTEQVLVVKRQVVVYNRVNKLILTIYRHFTGAVPAYYSSSP